MTNSAPQQSASLNTDDPPMSLDAARAVTWPFDTREPMGVLLDRGTLTRSKLQWAAEKAKWPAVRRAAQRLIEELEQQEATSASDPSSPSVAPAIAASAPPVAIPAPPVISPPPPRRAR